MMPVSWNGSKYVYTKVVRPFVREHEENIDSALGKVKKDAMNAVLESGAAEGESLLVTCDAQLVGWKRTSAERQLKTRI